MRGNGERKGGATRKAEIVIAHLKRFFRLFSCSAPDPAGYSTVSIAFWKFRQRRAG
jgi:hypothetical protein